MWLVEQSVSSAFNGGAVLQRALLQSQLCGGMSCEGHLGGGGGQFC